MQRKESYAQIEKVINHWREKRRKKKNFEEENHRSRNVVFKIKIKKYISD